MTKDEFMAYLRDTLIPDLRASGQIQMANDFIAASAVDEGASKVEFSDDGIEISYG